MMRVVRWGLGAATLGAALLVGLVGWNVWTYHRLTGEQWVADLSFERIGPGQFVAVLRSPGGESRRFALQGDDWQLDARLITWQPWMQLMGNDPIYRLDRIWGRYRDLDRARTLPPSVYALTENPGVDLWSLARDGGGWLPGVDAAYGTAVYLPMQDNADYRVTLGTKGLVVRPVNDTARLAISTWH
ncbi:MAG: cation/multidrug efflux pump [Halieaceae bacterium]|jgi:hypothetical protein|nr:cation/multidrug efflux pump [Halieaceae bacterium]